MVARNIVFLGFKILAMFTVTSHWDNLDVCKTMSGGLAHETCKVITYNKLGQL